MVPGTELEAMDDARLDEILAGPDEIVFSRTAPEDKLRIATRLQAAGLVVAMTGDGVNDAPALRKADIGVAMGVDGTDVAREAATMVLADDDFATLIRAVESGRRVYDNVRKFILYIFAHAVPEIVPFLVFALSGGADPARADGGPDPDDRPGHRDPARPGPGPRARGARADAPSPAWSGESIITPGMLLRAWAHPGAGLRRARLQRVPVGALVAAAGDRATTPAREAPLHETLLHATTMTFAGIVACQVGTAMAARTDRVSLFSVGVFSNRLLLAGIAFEIVLTAVAIYLPAAQSLLGTRPLDGGELAVLATSPSSSGEPTRATARSGVAGPPGLSRGRGPRSPTRPRAW